MAKRSNYHQYVEACMYHGGLDKPHIDKMYGEWGYWAACDLSNNNKNAAIFAINLNAKETKSGI